MKYPAVIHKDPDSDYGVTVPDLPGCFSAGASLEEALENAQEAILTHIEGLMEDDEPIPSPTSLESLREAVSERDAIWAVVSVDLGKLSERAKRVNITIPEKLLGKIDAFADKEGETRSELLVTAALEYVSKRSG